MEEQAFVKMTERCTRGKTIGDQYIHISLFWSPLCVALGKSCHQSWVQNIGSTMVTCLEPWHRVRFKQLLSQPVGHESWEGVSGSGFSRQCRVTCGISGYFQWCWLQSLSVSAQIWTLRRDLALVRLPFLYSFLSVRPVNIKWF